MTGLVNYFLHPMTWLLIGLFLLWWRWDKLKRGKRKIAVGCLLFFTYVTSTPFLPMKLNAYLEDQYPPLETGKLNKTIRYNILVLGGGMGYDDRLPATSLLEPVMMVRLVEGIRVYRVLTNSLLITSGYSSIGKKTAGRSGAGGRYFIGGG